MQVQLKPFNFEQALARAGLRSDGTPAAEAAPRPEPSFRLAMSDALRQVSAQQLQAQQMAREVSLDNPAVSLEETMLAMQKAQIGFQATVSVRNRLVQAYTEIMNMNV